MTREEALDILHNSSVYHPDYLDALNMAIEALEQTECEDCISREHLLGEIASLKESPWFKENTNGAMAIRKEAIEIVEDLCIRKEPSVNPQKIGHWIVEAGDRETGYGGCTMCSECSGEGDTEMDYCPNCGCRMVEPQESEE